MAAMDIPLERADLLQLDPMSNKYMLKLLPPGKTKKQKLVIGDDSGQLSCFEFKKGEPQIVFQTKVFDGPIACVALGGPRQKRDKIFCAQGQRLVGLTKTGNETFKLTSSHTESIRNIAVEESRIWTGCEYILNTYDNGHDSSFYMSRDQINGLVVDYIIRENELDTVLACQDNCLRIIHAAQACLEIPTPSPVTAVATMWNSEVTIRVGSAHLLYGMENGAFSAIRIEQSGESTVLWTVQSPTRRSPITCVKIHDITNDGCNEIIICRDDGSLEIYTQKAVQHMPQLAFAKEIGESIRAVECGLVNSSEYTEVILATYSGKIISFTSEPVLQRAQDDTYGRSVKTVSNENRIKHLRKEVDGLKKTVDKEKEKLKKALPSSTSSKFMSFTSTTTATVDSMEAFGAIADFPINTKFILNQDQAAYVLTIEIQSPMDLIILRSPVMLDLVDSEIGNSIVSITPPHLLTAGTESQHKFVCAFRCQSQERRMSITLRSTEGEHGDFLVTVVTAAVPKAAKVVKFPLKPLSLHCRVHKLSAEEEDRPRNRVRFSGSASISTMHDWIQSIFPDVPPHLPEDATSCTYYFKNSFTTATAMCSISRNEIVVESESASTIAIVKENVTRLANYRRVQLEETMNPNEGSVVSFLSLVRPKLEYQLSLANKMEILDSLEEITQQETDKSWLQKEYVDILANQKEIRKEFKQRAQALQLLSGIITDLFVDWHRLNGIDARHKLSVVQQTLLAGNFDGVVEFFLKKK